MSQSPYISLAHPATVASMSQESETSFALTLMLLFAVVVVLAVGLVVVLARPKKPRLRRETGAGAVGRYFLVLLAAAVALLVVGFFNFFGVLLVVFAFMLVRYLLISRQATALMVFATLGACMRQNLPLPTALEAEAAGQRGAGKRALHWIAHWLTQGLPMSQAIAQGYPKCPGFALAMVAEGEKMNQLPGAMEKVQAQLILQADRSRRIQPMHPMYPAVIILIATGQLTLLLIFVVPKFEEIFRGMGMQLPASTQLLLDISDTAVGPVMLVGWIAVLLVLPCLVLVRFRPRDAAKPYVLSNLGDWLTWHLPILGWFERNQSMLQAVSMLRLALTSGQRMDASLTSLSQLDTNMCYRHRLHLWAQRVCAGGDISQAARQCGVGSAIAWAFDQQVNPGNAPAVLAMLETFYRTRYGTLVNLARYILWPCVTLLLALTVGFIVFALYMPMVTMIQVTARQVLP